MAAAEATPVLAASRAAESAAPRRDDLPALANDSLEEYRLELLELAWRAASAFPLHPHLKNRSRAQEEVVDAALELGQLAHALRYVGGIENWRQGLGYANLAYVCVERGSEKDALALLEQARELVASPPDEDEQAWRGDRIRVRIAETLVLLGRDDEARAVEAAVTEKDSEGGKIEIARATRLDASAFDERFAEVDGVLMTGNFEESRNALEVCARLFDRFYDDDDKRFLLEERIKSGWSNVPTKIRVDILGQLVEASLRHDDRAKALALVDESKALIDGARWTPQHLIPLLAHNAVLRFRAGDADKARAQADVALALFEADPDAMVNMFRGEALRPLAEAYHALGMTPAALDVYALAVEHGVLNPNSRPRAIDLSETCLSLALHAVPPGERLAARLAEVFEGLGDPW